jgi:hypothetical protein
VEKPGSKPVKACCSHMTLLDQSAIAVFLVQVLIG